MKIVDLFSGAGGLTFGFYYKIVNGSFVKRGNRFFFANEINKCAASAFTKNFPDIPMKNCDIKSIDYQDLIPFLKGEDVDVIIGGPPCQSYSYIGKRIYDDKAKMYEEYLRMLSLIQPKMFVFENVKGILSMKNESGEFVMNVIRNKFGSIPGKKGYVLKYEVLNASNYGVPQNRERVVIVGIRDDLQINYSFPKGDNKKVTLQDAISDLPYTAYNHPAGNYLQNDNCTDYQRLMRNNCNVLTLHYAKQHSDKLQLIMQTLEPGQGKNDFNRLVDLGIVDERFRITSGYHNTYGRLVADKPCTTITNNFTSPSCLRCIHYDQNRTLSLREGARIQSFPDTFLFDGNESEIKKQIGNAVPPLFAVRIADSIEKALDGDNHA